MRNAGFNIGPASTPTMDHFDQALQLLASGQLDEARIYQEELLALDPENTDLLYNLGLCYVDLGQLDKGRELLHRCLQLMPGHSHACVALALGYQRAGDLPRAKEYTMQAQAAGTPWLSRTWAPSSARRATACGLSTICAAPWRSIPRTRRLCTASPSPVEPATSNRPRSIWLFAIPSC